MEGEGNFAQDGGEALNLDDDFNDSDDGSLGQNNASKGAGAGKGAPPAGKVEGQKLDN